MGRVLIVLFLLLPLVEIALFVIVGNAIGLWGTLAAVVLAGLFGAIVLRWQGLSTLGRLRTSIDGGALPARSVADAMMLGLAGILLLLPGFFTDILAVLLLLPPVRSWLYAWLRSRVKVVATSTGYPPGYGPPQVEDDTIELDSDEWRPR